MRVAILHDYLNQFGGAERVLMALLEIFPKADLYTLLYDEKRVFGFFKENLKRTSILDIPFIRAHHRPFIPLMPLATKTLSIDNNYDLIISSTSGYAKGFFYNSRDGHYPFHISYCNSLLRYAWEIDYLKNLEFSPWPMNKNFLNPITRFLRSWDKKACKKVNLFIANSKFIAEKIHSHYNREARVIYPPVDTEIFYPESTTPKKEYFLMAGRLLYYKGFDLGIKVFNRLKKPLKIAGAGPEMDKLRRLADPRYIEFISFLSDIELRQAYSNAKALVFPQIEDFGLVAAEAQACGLPVIAYDEGGGREIVEHGKTGLLFKKQSVQALMDAVRDFEQTSFDRSYIRQRAERFSKKQFKENIRRIVSENGFPV